MATPMEKSENNFDLIACIESIHSCSEADPKTQNQIDLISILTQNVSFKEFVRVITTASALKGRKFSFVLSAVIEISNKEWIFEGLINKDSSESNKYGDAIEALCHAISAAYANSVVPSFREREYVGYKSSDFVGVAYQASLIMRTFVYILNGLIEFDVSETKLHRLLIKCSLVRCAEHSNESNPWASKESVEQSLLLLEAICKAYKFKTLSEYLQSEAGAKIYSDFLLENQNQLTKAMWKCFPAAPFSFEFMLRHMQRPVLGDYIPQILPPTLLFVDDFEVHYKILGLCCLRSIIEKVSKTELRCLGRIDVIYDVLQKQMYTNDSIILDALFPVLILALDVFEQPTGVRCYCQSDEIMERFLNDANVTSNSAELRRVYSRHLSAFIELLDITVVRHSNKFITLLETYLQLYITTDDTTHLETLRALRSFIHVAWPRVSHHGGRLSKCLVRLMYDLASSQPSGKTENSNKISSLGSDHLQLLKLCSECLKLIDLLSPSLQLTNSLTELLKLEGGPAETFHTYLKLIIDEMCNDGISQSST